MSAEEQELTDALKKLSPEDLAKLKTALGGTKVVVAPRLRENCPLGRDLDGDFLWDFRVV